ncbi:cytochrome P450 2D14-like [Sceloporus undulatus]|uniref:cytochrome P450 2D14-like n=1 Tax=Sceloporus undulatus TaxID=8520 RepID=UPI001C4ACE02|nr:cytochrome P450 2D14-like [Sceloporus undulatus]
MDLLQWLSSIFISLWNNLTLLGISVIFSTLFLDFMKRRRCWSRYPPGPTSLPFIGTMLQIDLNRVHLSLTWLSKKYGNIYSLQYFWKNVVVLNGFKTVREALVSKSEDFADRPYFAAYNYLGYGETNPGLIMAKYSHAWKEQKRFAITTLRDFGMGKESLEQLVIKEAEHLCSEFSSQEGLSILGLLQAAPFLMRIPGFVHIFQHQKNFYAYMAEILKEHKESLKPSCKKCFADAFLEEMEKRKDDKNSLFSDNNLPVVIGDLFAAGTETTSATLRWGLLYMILYPNVQRKVQEEIDMVIGKNRSPKMEDQKNMSYTRAVIHEIQRYGNVIPAGLPHMTYKDTELEGYFIPKGTTVLINLSSVLKDEDVWENPHQFYPEHFLDANGQFAKQAAFLPFSAGPRVCAAEQLARMELFLFFTSLLQHFTFWISENQHRPREDGCFSFTLVPHPYKLQVVSR